MAIRDTLTDLAATLRAAPRGAARRTRAKGFAGTYGSQPDSESPNEADIEDYRRLFKHNRFARESITTYVNEVLEPGYYLVADQQGTVDELETWAEECAYVGGRSDRDLLPLLRRLLTEALVTGTGVIEHVGTTKAPARDELAALQVLRVETFKFYKRPGQNILVEPDDVFEGDEEYPRTADGSLAAFVQFDDALNDWYSDEENPFRLDEISLYANQPTPMTVGGNSVLAPAADILDEMDEKRADVTQAVRTMAYPHRMVKFGDEGYVWDTETEIIPFMEEFEPDNFEPGQSSGVPVDVNVEEFSGEVPEGVIDLEESDVDDVMTAMPIPKYELGAYEANINQFVSRSQENKQNLRIRSERRSLEAELTPIFKEKAEQKGLDTSGLKLKIAPQDGQDMGARRPGGQPQ